jgi:hypothetical protein
MTAADMAEISLTFKQGDGHGAPWVVIKAASVKEASDVLNEIRAKGVFDGVKAAAQEFRSATASYPPKTVTHEQAVKTIKKVMPGSEVTGDQQLPASISTQCGECSLLPQWREGISKSGTPYAGWYCLNKDCGRYWKEVK